MRVRVSSTVDRFKRTMDDAALNQVPFALAQALTWTAQSAQRAVQASLPKKFTIRRPFVSQSIKINPAKKATRPFADVGVTPRAAFMVNQETGGTKHSKSGHRLGVPVRSSKNTAGFPNKAALVPRSQTPAKMRGKPRVFVVNTRYGATIAKREGEARYPLVFLYWLKREAPIKPAFGFKRTTADAIGRDFATNFEASIAKALASAR